MAGDDVTGPSNPVIVQNVQDAPFPTGVVLDDTNYPLWYQLMEMRIGARSKTGFLTGSATKPTTNEKAMETWITDNNRVKSWLIDSMTPTLMRRFIRLQTAAEIWEAVRKTFYDGSDETQLFELNRKSFNMRQIGSRLKLFLKGSLAYRRMALKELTEKTVILALTTQTKRLSLPQGKGYSDYMKNKMMDFYCC